MARKIHGWRCGFTLVELMIVCSIIMVLIGVAMPSYRQYKRQARATACVSLLRQMQAAKEAHYSHSVDGTMYENLVVGPNRPFQTHPKCPEINQDLSFGANGLDLPSCKAFTMPQYSDYPHSLTACFTY